MNVRINVVILSFCMTQDSLLNTNSDTFSVCSRENAGVLYDFSDMWVIDRFTPIHISVYKQNQALLCICRSGRAVSFILLGFIPR